jgi:hypothetical protein
MHAFTGPRPGGELSPIGAPFIWLHGEIAARLAEKAWSGICKRRHVHGGPVPGPTRR